MPSRSRALVPLLAAAALAGRPEAWPHDAFNGVKRRGRGGPSIDDVLRRARSNPGAPAWPSRKSRSA